MFEIKIPLPLSPSRLNEWSTCPRKFFYHVRKYPTIHTDMRHAELGTMIHEVAADYFMECSNLPKDDEIEGLIMDIFDEKWRSKPVYNLEEKAAKCIDNLIKKEKERVRLESDSYKPTHIEYDFTAWPFHGIIDWYNADTGIIRDWKTNTSPDFSDDMLRQGLIYKNIIKHNGLKANMVIFEMLVTGTSQIMPLVKNKWLADQLIDMRDNVQKMSFIKKPKQKNNTFFCNNFCAWRVRCDTDENQGKLGKIMYKSK